MLLPVACSDTADENDADENDDGALPSTVVAAPETTTAPAEAPATAEPPDPRRTLTGEWTVGEAGTVAFDVSEGNLVLIDVNAVEGWESQVIEEDPGTIEVAFTQGPAEYEFEAERLGEVLEVGIGFALDPAEAGRFEVGDAGSVEFSVTGTSLELVEVTTASGWDHTETVESDEIEVAFQRDAEGWDFEVELDDGVLDLRTAYGITGPLP